MSLTLVIGGTRSGKSAHAERLASASGLPVRYIATADGSDPDMAERIRAHAARRPPAWTTVEAGPESLADALADTAGVCVLVDGLGPWIATAMYRAGASGDSAAGLARVREQLLVEIDSAVQMMRSAGAAIVVAEQAGDGVLPGDPMSRAWLDALGEATQRIADHAQRVELVVAGRALLIAGEVDSGPVAELRRHGDSDVRTGDADHAVNVLAGGPPSWLREALSTALDRDAGRYPDEREATVRLAALHGRRPEEIVPTNGAAEALWLLADALRPRLAACVHPGFTETEAALHVHGVPVVRVLRDPARGFALDPDMVPNEADLVVVGNPVSATGTLDPSSAVLALRRPGRVVVVDEAFMDLVPGEPATLVRERLDDVIVVRSLTKALSIPGVRAGYAVAAAGLAARLRAARPPWSANALALAALAAAASRPKALAAAAERAAREREDLVRRLDDIGVRTWPGVANFCLIEVADGPAVVAALRERAIAVRPAGSFPGLGPGHLRITARSGPENERLANALEEAVESCAP